MKSWPGRCYRRGPTADKIRAVPYTPFHLRFPELARVETRFLIVPHGEPGSLPADAYGFIEHFCDEPGCDCRRVLFLVRSQKRARTEAVIAWGWESREFYARWVGDDAADVVDGLIGPELHLGAEQSELAPLLLDWCSEVLLRDAAFTARVRAHYARFREDVAELAREDEGGRPHVCEHDHEGGHAPVD